MRCGGNNFNYSSENKLTIDQTGKFSAA